MITVKVRRSMHGSEFGSVRSGGVVEVSETTARAWIARGLAAEVAAQDEAQDETQGEAKDAATAKNKMAPPPRHNDPPPPPEKKPAEHATPSRKPRSK
jgi:hypothetical protein